VAFVLASDECVFEQNIVAESSGNAAVYMVLVDNLENSCNVFWNNAAGDFDDYPPDATDRVVDPLFCNTEAGDFTLHSLSPCLPANSMGCGLIGALGEGCGTVSVEPSTWGRIKASFRGEEE